MKKILCLIVVAALTAVPCLAQTKSKTRIKPNTRTPQTEEERKAVAAAPEGATAICGDRSYSFSKSKKPCEGHEGVIFWLVD